MDVSDPFDMIQSHYLSQDMGLCCGLLERLSVFSSVFFFYDFPVLGAWKARAELLTNH